MLCRYEIEQQLLKGEISIDDIPKLWNAKMQEYLGCTPKNDAEGCLQDVHWSAGIMGYFPTYSLGAMYACQIYQVCAENHNRYAALPPTHSVRGLCMLDGIV